MSTNENLDPSLVYKPLEGIQRPENYQSGGNHPIEIGDYLHN